MKLIALLVFFVIPTLACGNVDSERPEALLRLLVLSRMGESVKTPVNITQLCTGFRSLDAEVLCHRIERAKKSLDSVQVNFAVNAKGEVTHREFALAVWRITDDAPSIIMLRMPLYPQGEFQPEVIGKSGYTVVRTGGRYLYKLTFQVTIGDEEVPVYAGKHLFVHPRNGHPQTLSLLNTVADRVVYAPMTKWLYHEEFFEHGLSYLRERISEGLYTLRKQQMMSQAYPGKLLADVFSLDQLVRIPVIEQVDPYRYYGVQYLTRQGGASEKHLLKWVFAEIYHWRDGAFRTLCSRANACGIFQFTNNPTGKYPGTYTFVAEMCRGRNGERVIDPDFWSGVSRLPNAAMAAVCLLDHELAQLPRSVRALHLEDPHLGLMFPIVAYNAGGSWARDVFLNIEKLRNGTERKVVAFIARGKKKVEVIRGEKIQGYTLGASNYEQLPHTVFEAIRNGKPFFNEESCYYAFKWLETWRGFDGKIGFVPNCKKGG